MNTSPSRAVTALSATLALGIGADLLLRTTPWGLNAFLWVAGLAVAASLCTRASPLDGGIGAPLLFFSGMLVWTDAPVLTALNVVAVIGLLVVPVLRRTGTGVFRARGRHLLETGRHLARGLAGVPRLVPESGILALPTGHTATSFAVGAVVTVPVAAVFVSLFGEADPAFGRFADRLLSPRFVESGLEHLFFASLFAWPAGAYLRAVSRPARTAPALYAPSLGLSAVTLPIGATILIFAAFLWFQAAYLFGGAAFLAGTPGLTTAEYARRGFFELVTASALVVPLLMASQWALRPGRRPRRVFGALSVALIALVVGVVGSAFHRMLLYWQAFGLSQDRVYAMVFIAWIGFVLGWFAWTQITRRVHRFLSGAAVAAFGLLAVANLVNVDAVVTRTNLWRAAAGYAFDVRYHVYDLSADAVPTLLAGLDRLEGDRRCQTVEAFRARWEGGERDWRSWNLSRWRAEQSATSADLRGQRAACRG